VTEPVVRTLEWPRVDTAVVNASAHGAPHETGPLERLDVLGRRGERDPVRRRQLAHRQLSLGEPLEHRAPGVVAQCSKNEVQSCLMFNHIVEYQRAASIVNRLIEYLRNVAAASCRRGSMMTAWMSRIRFVGSPWQERQLCESVSVLFCVLTFMATRAIRSPSNGDCLPSADLPTEIRVVEDALRAFHSPWAIAGGWALDLALGRATRSHADVDIAVFRDDQAALRAALTEWHFEVVIDGVLTPWKRAMRLELPVHEVHATPPAGAPGAVLELLLNERDGSDWVYRRDPSVRLPLTRSIRPAAGGVRVLAPEIVLLYKSKAPRPTDQRDFRAALPLLDAEARAWLRTALVRAEPSHPWVGVLAPYA
jgi:hypothetical protein